MVDKQVNSNGKDFKLRRQEGLKQSFEKSSEELEVRSPAGLCRNEKKNPFWVDTIPQVLCMATECSPLCQGTKLPAGLMVGGADSGWNLDPYIHSDRFSGIGQNLHNPTHYS